MSSFGEFNCIFCKETFADKETLQIHFRKHGDPKYNQQKKLGDGKISDDKCNESAEMVSCDVCPEVFPTISKAITHKHKVHPDHDAKYFCLWCGKLFTMKHLYNKHMQANHTDMEHSDGKTFRCDCCEVDFLAAPAMLCHNKFFHRSDTDLPSVGLSKKQKLYNQESIPVYYCPFCGEEYENKVNLHKHMGDDHADENQTPDEVLRCPLCEALLYHLDAYEIHLTFHTAEDYYSDYNEIRHQIAEYSLETVAPIVEKVENYEQPSEHGGDTSNAMGIDQFLQLAMDDTDNGPKKSKKHKKHKKSKKNTITLDEFLNMNKDMFGEEVDVHGIEEVPTTAVARRLTANKKPPQKLKKPVSKFVPSDIQKLKLQGIVVKKKPVVNTFITQTNTPTGQNKTLKISQKVISKNIKPVQNKINTNSLSTSNEVLSKLLNQSNNQIKIVKKSAQSSMTADEDYPNISEDSRKQDDLGDKCSEPEHTDTEDPADDALQMNENTSKLISQSTVSERTSTLDRLESPEDIDSNLYADDLKSGNQETSKILSSTDKATVENVCEKFPKDQSAQNTEYTSEEEEEINNLRRDSKDGDRDEESKAIFTENNSILMPRMDKDKHNEEMYNSPVTENNSTSESLSALKHLSHLITIKPVTKNSIDDKELNTVTSSAMDTSITKQLDDVPSVSDNSDKAQINQTPNVNKQQKSLNYFKNLNKNISIKSLNQSSKTCKSKYNEDVYSEEEIEPKTSITGRHTPVTSDGNKSHVITTKNIKNSTTQPPTSKVVIKSIADKPKKELLQDKTTDQVNANLLKRLTNITAKPLYSSTDLPKEVDKSNKNTSIASKNIAKKIVSKEIDEGIEIFNIDDSDSDNDQEIEQIKRNMDSQVSKPPTQSIDALKNLSKHITIKNMRQEISKTFEREESVQEACENKTNTFSEHKQFVNKTFQSYSNKSDQTSANNKNSTFDNILKNVGKNITVKSGTRSPSQSVTSQDNNIHSNNENSDDSDTDFYPGKVKITEIENDDPSDHEIDGKQENLTQDDAHSQHVQVQSPDGSWSDREGSINEDMMEEELDIETQINVNKLTKPTFKGNSTSLHNLKGISKDITIKSVNEKKCQSRTNESSENDTNTELAVKPFKQARVEQGNKCSNTSSSSRVETFSNANNQMNTINKEVTVKTFQTQTVIQEITTTVTKTIRTVNQTVNQSSSKSMIQPQRLLGMRPIHVGRNLQGVTVGHRSPNIGCKIRNATPSPRPVVRNPGQPSNQLAVVRPRLSTPRQNAPRMPVLQRAPTTPNQARPGKSLKISPQAITSSVNKRQSSEETSGPFSCFKKPKETLYPATDLPSTCNNSKMPNVQYSSSSQSSKSNVTTTKIIKGNSVVTSTHMKSEASATSQQLSKLSILSGLKIVKTNQRQEHVQEKSKTSANRTTLDTIEKLQKQGLLVKKPRLDDDEVSNHSEPEDDYAVEYSSTEENDN